MVRWGRVTQQVGDAQRGPGSGRESSEKVGRTRIFFASSFELRMSRIELQVSSMILYVRRAWGIATEDVLYALRGFTLLSAG